MNARAEKLVALAFRRLSWSATEGDIFKALAGSLSWDETIRAINDLAAAKVIASVPGTSPMIWRRAMGRRAS